MQIRQSKNFYIYEYESKLKILKLAILWSFSSVLSSRIQRLSSSIFNPLPESPLLKKIFHSMRCQRQVPLVWDGHLMFVFCTAFMCPSFCERILTLFWGAFISCVFGNANQSPYCPWSRAELFHILPAKCFCLLAKSLHWNLFAFK